MTKNQNADDNTKTKNNENKVKLSVEDTREIAKLARIKLSKEEEEKFTIQLNNILEYFKKISELNTENITPQTHPTDIVNSFRKDEIGNSLSQEEALMNAPRKEDGYFKAPKIV
ncbi:MAG: Asp-tRNA(Asn)/Glu-tRNA(Gln) amidotransferase subunit GatC [Candidatus Helarchaeota archaeon]